MIFGNKCKREREKLNEVKTKNSMSNYDFFGERILLSLFFFDLVYSTGV